MMRLNLVLASSHHRTTAAAAAAVAVPSLIAAAARPPAAASPCLCSIPHSLLPFPSPNTAAGRRTLSTTTTDDDGGGGGRTRTAHRYYRSKLGIGGSKLAHVRPEQYASVIATSLRCGVNTFESGHGGESSLARAFVTAWKHFEEVGEVEDVPDGPVTLTARFGYRTVAPVAGAGAGAGAGTGGEEEEGENPKDGGGAADASFPNDVVVESDPAAGGGEDGAAKEAASSAETAAGPTSIGEEEEDGDDDGGGGGKGTSQDGTTDSDEDGDGDGDGAVPTEEETSGTVVHNLSREYASYCLGTSPLVKLRRDDANARAASAASPPPPSASPPLTPPPPEIDLIYMAHNPEAQGSAIAARGAPLDDVRGYVKERLTDAFVGLEAGVAERLISSYGVCSNGLGLPPAHPLHLPWMDVLEAASDAVGIVHGDNSTVDGLPDGRVAALSTIQLPANLLETSGLKVAASVRTYLKSVDGDDGDETPPKFPNLPPDVDVYVTRPLTCYPDRGTGTGHPFKLVDHQIETTSTSDLGGGPVKVWTNEIVGSRPPHYGPALATTMGHFDATSILEAGRERKLTVEERETLDGCRLLQSMIHDLDSNLDHVRSFAAYEDDLYRKVVPLINDTFEELDEESSDVLRAFFLAHGSAVRHAVARNTRNLLREGGDGVEAYGIPDEVTLQDFALRYLLGDGNVGKVIVGCPQPEHVLEAMRAADHLDGS